MRRCQSHIQMPSRAVGASVGGSRMRCPDIRASFCMAVLGVAIAYAATSASMSETLAQTASGQSTSTKSEPKPKSQLELRLNALERPSLARLEDCNSNSLRSLLLDPFDDDCARIDAYVKERAKIIKSSDPVQDARTDASNGVIGFMVTASVAFGGAPYATGLRCLDINALGEHVAFSKVHGDYVTEVEGEELIAFRDYAMKYNLSKTLSNQRKIVKCKT